MPNKRTLPLVIKDFLKIDPQTLFGPPSLTGIRIFIASFYRECTKTKLSLLIWNPFYYELGNLETPLPPLESINVDETNISILEIFD